MGAMQGAIDVIAREAMLFAAVGLLIGGIDDLLIDVAFLIRRAWRGGRRRLSVSTLPKPTRSGRMAVFVPAWDEEAVIGAMLTTALDRYRHHDYRIYVGLYPNDGPTIAAAMAVARADPRVRLVIGNTPGPTTKAGCLNTLWHALLTADAVDGCTTKAIVFHDAEDVVHPDELTVFDSLIEGRAVVQLPVLPLVKRGSRFVSGHYADEFAEAHAKSLVVRTALGAGMPLAGTGCAVAPAMIARIAAARGGDPFDPASLVEDYELGLRIAEMGGRGLFARVTDERGDLVAVRAYFPATLGTAVRQKARWITGIALVGWDRVGWARPLALVDHWMRMRDRRAPIAVLVLGAAYLSIVAWLASVVSHGWTGVPVMPVPEAIRLLLIVNAWLLGWRLIVRAAFTARTYGWREAMWSVPRLVVGNLIALLAAGRAIWRYIWMLRGAAPAWDKTQHEFPALDRPIDAVVS